MNSTTAPAAEVRPSASPQPLPQATPVAYLVWHHTQRCRCCNRFHEWTQLILKSEIPARFGMGKPVSQMRVVDKFEWNLPVEHRVSTLHGIPEIPVCHECLSTEVAEVLTSTLPIPPQVDTRQLKPIGRFGVLAAPPKEAPKAGVRKSEPKARVLSVDELLSGLE